MRRYKIADVVFDASFKYKYTAEVCKNYEYNGDEKSIAFFEITDSDIAKEKINAPDFHDAHLENLALFRKLCSFILTNAQGIIFHSSAVMVNNNAYLFTAPSGTGKSTHTRLWRELLGDKAVMINDDKPIIRFVDGNFYVYGTPWNGKHRLDTNCRAKVKAICKISQAKENVITPITPAQMLPVIFNQTLYPNGLNDMDKLLSYIDKLLKSVDLYSLGCNISKEAAMLSYQTMSGERL